MIVDVNLRLQVPTLEVGDEMRGFAETHLNSYIECDVIASSSAKVTRSFVVKGVNLTTEEPFIEPVEAEDEAEAQAQVESATMIVVEVADA